MNKNSLLLTLIAGTAPLIAQDKPRQVLESLMQPLPSVAANIKARAAAFPALRQIPSNACAFIVMTDVQGNITKLLNSKLVMAASEGKSTAGIANILPIESIAIAFEQGAEVNIAALFKLINNISKGNKHESMLKGVNKADINLPEMRIIASMKPNSEAVVAQMKQQFKALCVGTDPRMLSEQDGYTVLMIPQSVTANILPYAPEGSMDAFFNIRHYLAIKFEGNCISIIYSRDLKKISAPSSIEQSMLASDKLTLSDAYLTQGIVGSSFVNAALMGTISNEEQDAPSTALLKNIFKRNAKMHPAQAPVFKALALSAGQVSKMLKDLRENFKKQSPQGDYTNVLWNSGKLNYASSLDYPQSTWSYNFDKQNVLCGMDRIEQGKTISYLDIVFKETQGSITLYADNVESKAELCKSSYVTELFNEGSKWENQSNYNIEHISLNYSTSLHQSLQSCLSRSAASKNVAGFVFYFNGKAIVPILKDEKEKEKLQVMPEFYSIAYPNEGKLIFRALLQ